jgi:hypothetical protein
VVEIQEILEELEIQEIQELPGQVVAEEMVAVVEYREDLLHLLILELQMVQAVLEELLEEMLDLREDYLLFLAFP